jgi:hypothetical protein
LLSFLRHLAAPQNWALATDIDRQKTIENLEYLDSLRLNKNEEAKK